MKRCDHKIVGDRVEMHLVYDQMEETDPQEKDPEIFLLIGPPGGPLARVESVDLDILATLMNRAQLSTIASSRQARYLPRGLPPGWGGPGCAG